jgi:acyl-coenzyme A thioesterase PaaI-like protein
VKESGLRIRVDSQLRVDFLRACKKDDLTAAQVLRAFMRMYLERQQRGQQTELFSEEELNVIKFGRGQ